MLRLRTLIPSFHRSLEKFRLQLARPDALIWHALLGLLTGLAAAWVIVAFRLVVEGTQHSFLPDNGDNYEGLSPLVRFLLPVLGALCIGLIFARFARGVPVLGVARVMERMEYHQGRLCVRGLILQFIGAAIGIISGHSVGREGPNVHLGAASGSLIGQWLSLPNNTIRNMAACGTAAGISASFNTPLAGVIFALEVLALDYSIAGFIPVILAAGSANAVAVSVFGNAPAFPSVPFAMDSLADLLPVVMLGLLAGGISAAYIQSLQTVARIGRHLSYLPRICLAGVLAGLCGVVVPEVMGLGYDTQRLLLIEHLPWLFLLVLLAGKLVATSCSAGLGIPGGTIGPALFMGAIVGNLVSGVTAHFVTLDAYHGNFFALLGMGAMMGASLQAPLAGLTAVVELSHSPGMIMPGMLVIILAALTSSQMFGKDSLFLGMLRANGLDYRTSPVVQALRRIGVGGVMNRDFVRQHARITQEEAARLLSDHAPRWILVDQGEDPVALVPGIALAAYVAHAPEEEEIDLLSIPAERLEVAPVHVQSTLQEALEILQEGKAEALYVERPIAPGIHHVYGILTRARIESAYRF